MSRTAGLLLAAGAGRRFGRPKALVVFDGSTLLERGVRLLCDGGCDPVVVVVGAAAEQVRLLVPPGARTVTADDWAEGMAASLRTGLRALHDTDADAVVVALVDQPCVGVEAVRRLVAASGTQAAVATYAGQARNPVRLDRSVWDDVAAGAVGDTGARRWLREHPELVARVPCDDTGSPFDVDTPADLALLASRRRPGGVPA